MTMQKIIMTKPVSLEQVKSSCIAGMAYVDGDLFVRMGNHVYAYHGVPETAIAEMKAAPSLGRFVNQQIKPRYRCHEVQFAGAAAQVLPEGLDQQDCWI